MLLAIICSSRSKPEQQSEAEMATSKSLMGRVSEFKAAVEASYTAVVDPAGKGSEEKPAVEKFFEESASGEALKKMQSGVRCSILRGVGEGGESYDVKYALGGREKKVSWKYVRPASFLASSQRARY